MDNFSWAKIAGLIFSSGMLIYLRWSDPKAVAGRKKSKIAALRARGKKLENERDYILDHPTTPRSGCRLNAIVFKLAVLRKQIRELEEAD